MSVSLRLSRPEHPAQWSLGKAVSRDPVGGQSWATVALGAFWFLSGPQFPTSPAEGGMDALGGARMPGCAVCGGEDPCQPS